VLRWVIGLLLLVSASTAFADPVLLLLLLRAARDHAISASIEAGVNTMQRQYSTMQSPAYGFSLPVPAIPRAPDEQQLRALIDENFLHLTSMQRDEVFVSMGKILQDPQHLQDKSQLMAEFAQKAREVRECYRGLDALAYSEKRLLAKQAKEVYRGLPEAERQQLLDVLQSGTLPVPRDLRDIMLAEFSSVAPADGANAARPIRN
jgi:hypothetical protein